MGLVAAAAFCTAGSAPAQFAQYTGPGSLAAVPVPTRERLEAAVADARYRLGPVAWSPFFAIKDVNYIKGESLLSEDREADLTATAALGVHAYLQPRQTVFFAMHAVPEYAYWRRNEARTVTNWSSGVGVFVFSRPVTLEAVAVSARHQEILSSAVEELVNVGRSEARGTVEAPLRGRLALWATASTIAWRYRQEDAPGEAGRRLVALDRDEERLGGGLRLRWREGFVVGMGYEQVTLQFVRNERDRSATGTAPVVEVEWQGRRWGLTGRVSRPALAPEAGSEFVPFEDTVGSAQLRFAPSDRTRFSAYGGRFLAFTYADASPYFLDRRTGIAVERRFGYRSSGNVFYELGSQDFASGAGVAEGRREELTTVGAMLTVQLHRSLTLAAGASRSEYEPRPGAELGRSLTRVQLALRSGNVRAQWW